MDSLTQITLGAAVGEVVLGKKAGNRAMLWGAIAGTLPDLDVFANLITDPISALGYHRAFTHSITFALIVPLGLGMLVHRIYGGKESPLPQHRWGAILATWLFLLSTIFVGSSLMPVSIDGIGLIALIVSSIAMLFPITVLLRERYRRQPTVNENPSWTSWSIMLFWAIITHPLLDACTAYGTQLFEPFSSLRIAWNVISVADPLYTAPFLLFLILASRQRRNSQKRSRYNMAGIVISSCYLLLCTTFQAYASHRLEATLDKEHIQPERYTVGPTILNSILWNGTAETNNSFHTGQYGFLDSEPFFKLQRVPKQHELLEGHWDDPHINMLRWFTNDYFSVEELPNNQIRINDLRYGIIDSPEVKRTQYIFYFVLQKIGDEYRSIHVQQGPEDRELVMGRLFDRIRGF